MLCFQNVALNAAGGFSNGYVCSVIVHYAVSYQTTGVRCVPKYANIDPSSPLIQITIEGSAGEYMHTHMSIHRHEQTYTHAREHTHTHRNIRNAYIHVYKHKYSQIRTDIHTCKRTYAHI